MDVTVSFADRKLTAREKVWALVSFGLADDTDEAIAMLVDMGEVSEGDPSLYQDDGEPDGDDEDEWDDEEHPYDLPVGRTR